jgi:hypothetical protein
MTDRLAYCPLELTLDAALVRMAQEGVEVLLVRNGSGQVVGLLPRVRALESLASPDDRPEGPLPDEVSQVRGDSY